MIRIGLVGDTRKSTSGGYFMLGSHVIKVRSNTQFLIAFSSGEVELYAILCAVVESLDDMSMVRDMDYRVSGQIWSDVSVALDIIYRKDMDKTLHIDIGWLWIQQTITEQKLKFQKMLGKHIPTDLLTNHVDQATSEGHTETLNYKFNIGRVREASKLHMIKQSVGDIILNNNQKEWQSLHVLLGKRSKWIVNDDNWRYGRRGKETTSMSRIVSQSYLVKDMLGTINRADKV